MDHLFHFILLSLLIFVEKVCCICYFSLAYQGTYVTQIIVSDGSVGSDIHYLSVNIQADSIPIWGVCHRRLGNNVILFDRVYPNQEKHRQPGNKVISGEKNCVRCFHLERRSLYILEIHTKGLARCFTTEAAALETCPTLDDIRNGATREIMLYKTKGPDDKPLEPVFCPISGRFRFTYDQNIGKESVMECPEPTSRIANCPRGNYITLAFQRCSFTDFAMEFGCLGDWEGTDGQRYLALFDPEADSTTLTSSTEEVKRPRYRCAKYNVQGPGGRIFLSLSSDSTCTNNINSAWEGYETLVLNPIEGKPLPSLVSAAICTFPAWSQGQWEDLRVEKSVLSYTDHSSFKTYEVHCLAPERSGNVPVFAQSHCGEVVYTCLAMQERSSNVMEFQISSSVYSTYQENLCSREASWNNWITQGRVDRFKQSPCPVAGEYTGVLPDAPMLCAKLYSDCNNPEIMFYTVYSCYNRSEVFEEREYRCLGQWSENAVTYTYTERRDVASYECFAGVVVNDGEIYVIEAGANCQRGLQAIDYGMKLVKQAACLNYKGPPGRPSQPPLPPWKSTPSSPKLKNFNDESTPKPKWKDDNKSCSPFIRAAQLNIIIMFLSNILFTLL